MADPVQAWYDAAIAEAKAKNDKEILRLVGYYDQATTYMETDPDQALALLSQGQALARQLGQPCWVLFFEHWQVAVNLFHKQDFKTALDQGVRFAVEARKAIYQDCPLVPRTNVTLLDAYLRTDPIGYEAQIRETIAYLQANFNFDDEIRGLMIGRLYYLEMVMSRYNSALQLALQTLADASTDNHRLIGAYQLLSDVCYRLDNPKEGLPYAQAGETHARRGKHYLRALVTFLAWQALFTWQLGDERTARRLHNIALTHAVRVGAKLYESYYDAMCLYYELDGDYPRSMSLRDTQLADILTSNSIYDESKIRIRRLKLLTKTGLPLDEELAAARAVAARMIKPDFYLSKLNRVLSGDVSDRW